MRQAVDSVRATDGLTFTVDYTIAQTRSRRIAASRPSGQQGTSFDQSCSTPTDGVTTPRTSSRAATVGHKDFGYEQQRNEQKNKLDSVGFNANWEVTDAFGLARLCQLAGQVPAERSDHGRKCDGVQLRGHEVPDDESAVLVRGQRWSERDLHGLLDSGVPVQRRPADHDAHVVCQPGGCPSQPGGNSDLRSRGNQLGSQVLRINYQRQETEVKQARLDGKLEFENGRFQFGFDTRKVEMNQKTSGGYLEMGNWSVNDALQATGMVDMVSAYNLSGLFSDFSSSGSPTQAFRGNATQLGLWAINSGQIATGRDPVTLAARAPRRYNDWSDASMPDGVLAYHQILDNDNTVEEDVKAVYMQFGVKGELGSMPTNLLIGVRYEDTKVTSTGMIVVPQPFATAAASTPV